MIRMNNIKEREVYYLNFTFPHFFPGASAWVVAGGNCPKRE